MNKVSVIIPVYNQGQFLDVALRSVLEQSYQNWECIIVNDGSTDETESISLKWCFSDERIKYYKKSNGGLSSSRNFGLQMASGDFIQFLDSDDYLDKEKLELSVKNISVGEGSEKDFVISNFRMFRDNKEDSFEPFCQLKLSLFKFECILLKWDEVFNIPIHCGFFKKDLFFEFQFSEKLKAKEDWLMWLHMFRNTPQVAFINEPLAFYRIHPESMTRNRTLMDKNLAEAIDVIKENYSDDSCVFYCFLELQKSRYKIRQLQSSLKNIRNSRTNKYSEVFKKSIFGKFFLGIIAKK